MLDFKVVATGPDSIATDITADAEKVTLLWPATTDLPTCELQMNNQTGKYSRGPLFSKFAVTLPNALGTYNFYSETNKYQADRNQGTRIPISGRAAPELLFLMDGNLSVVGTDLAAPVWDNQGTSYAPFTSTYVTALKQNLLDVGDLLTALLHAPQPDQISGYRGRAGYDISGMGVKASTGLDYTGGSLGYYVKGMWQIGYGRNGAQKAAFDIVKDALTGNVIDNTGQLGYLDFYIDHTQTPPLLKVFSRGSVDSGVGFTAGTDPVEDLELPVDTTNVKNFVIYWVNPETQYPLGGDAWTNYANTSDMAAQWVEQAGFPTGTGTWTTQSAYTRYGTGYAMDFDNTGPTGSSSLNYVNDIIFDLSLNGYDVLTPIRGLSQFNVSLMRDAVNAQSANDSVYIWVTDTNGKRAYDLLTLSNTPGEWQDNAIAIPGGGWVKETGFDWTTSIIAKVELVVTVGSGAENIYVDYLGFTDNWDFQPVYSYVESEGAGGSALTATYVSGSSGVTVLAAGNFFPGEYVVLSPGTTRQEVIKIDIVSVSTKTITFTTTTVYQHDSGEYVNPATHDPNSVSAYGLRIFPYVDYYINNGISDGAVTIVQSLLQSRKTKQSSGSLKVWGYAPQVRSIKPGSLFQYTDPKNVYVGNTAIDSTIYGWLADAVQFDIDRNSGFIVTYTVEPYYQAFVASSPDSNRKNLWNTKNIGALIGRLFRQTRYFGVQK
jgi:hypothetical protein